MSSPFLDLALGATRGVKSNRERAIADEERKRRQDREDLALRLQLAQLTQSPDFEVTPFLDAALGGDQGGGAPPAPSVGRPAAEAGIGGVGAAPTPGPRGPMLEDQAPIAPAAPPPPPAAPAAPRAPAGPAAGPAAPHVDAALGGADEGIDLGAVDVGGQKYRIRAKSKPKRAEAANRAAFEALHRADAEAYPEYIQGMPEGYYAEELSDYAQGVRAGRIEDKRARREGTAARERQAVEARRDAARDQVFSLAQGGKSFEEIVAALAQDHELRGVLTRSEVRREMQSAGQINAPDREKGQRMTVLKTQLGKPPTPASGAGAIDAELQQDIIEALADGHSAEEVLEALGDSPAVPTVRRWLRRGRQLTRPTTP
jgi:hypothetical protein